MLILFYITRQRGYSIIDIGKTIIIIRVMAIIISSTCSLLMPLSLGKQKIKHYANKNKKQSNQLVLIILIVLFQKSPIW